MSSIRIEKVNIKDVDQLLAISEKTFIQTFAEQNNPSALQNYLDSNFTLEKIQQQLSNSLSEFYFAKMDGEIIGYLKLNYGNAQTESRGRYSLEIQRIYILNGYQGQNLGRMLLNKAIERAKAQSLKILWLGVWKENHKAIRFYQKQGFVEVGEHLFLFGDEKQTDAIMELSIN